MIYNILIITYNILIITYNILITTCNNMSSYSLPSVTQSLFRDQPSRLFALLWKIPGPFLDENRSLYNFKPSI